MVPPAVVHIRLFDADDRQGLPIGVQGWSEFGFGLLNAVSLELTMFDAQGRSRFTCALADESPPPRRR